jgi:hypothetical protein
MPRVTVDLSDDEIKVLNKRAKKNLLSLKEQVENIIRRSCVSYKGGPKYSRVKPDDRLVGIFSREMRGRKRKKK